MMKNRRRNGEGTSVQELPPAVAWCQVWESRWKWGRGAVAAFDLAFCVLNTAACQLLSEGAAFECSPMRSPCQSVCQPAVLCFHRSVLSTFCRSLFPLEESARSTETSERLLKGGARFPEAHVMLSQAYPLSFLLHHHRTSATDFQQCDDNDMHVQFFMSAMPLKCARS